MTKQVVSTTVKVTLVHGTFSKDASWTLEGSQFREWLGNELRAKGVKVIKFDRLHWSGNNSHSDRMSAADKLRRQIESEVTSCQHFIIGHSHGGTVISYALRGKGLDDKIAGVVFLATPFFSVLPRSLKSLWQLFDIVGFSGLCAIGVMVFGSFQGNIRIIPPIVIQSLQALKLYPVSNYGRVGILGLEWIANLMVAILLFYLYRIMWIFVRDILEMLRIRCEKYGDWFASEADSKFESDVVTLNITVMNDEARGWLQVVGRVGQSIQRFFGQKLYLILWCATLLIVIVSAYMRGLDNVVLRSLTSISVLAQMNPDVSYDVNTTFIFTRWMINANVFLTIILISAILSAVVVSMLGLISQLAVAIFSRLLLGGWYSFGSLSILDLIRNWIVSSRVSAEPSFTHYSTCNETVDLHQIDKLFKPRWLWHSAPYQNKKVVDRIANWIWSCIQIRGHPQI
jgi:hypothetical protein